MLERRARTDATALHAWPGCVIRPFAIGVRASVFIRQRYIERSAGDVAHARTRAGCAHAQAVDVQPIANDLVHAKLAKAGEGARWLLEVVQIEFAPPAQRARVLRQPPCVRSLYERRQGFVGAAMCLSPIASLHP